MALAACSLLVTSDSDALIVGAICLTLARNVHPTPVVVRNQAIALAAAWGSSAPPVPPHPTVVSLLSRFHAELVAQQGDLTG